MTVGINQSFYNPISRPQFRGQQTNPNTEPQKKEGLSTGAKWSIGLGLTALAAVGMCIASKGSAGAKSAKQIAEHIEFKPAKTVEEAKKFAQEKLGVKLNLEDLEIANYVNEGLVNVNNKLKGKSVMPNYVVLHNFGGIHSNAFMAWSNKYKTLKIGPGVVKMAEQARKQKITLAECIHLKDKKYLGNINPFHYVHHELGHANHHAVCQDVNKMGKLEELAQRGITDTHYTDDFLKEINAPGLKESFHQTFPSYYANASPAEFVAEVFANIIDGATVPKEFLSIYKKYGGPAMIL